MIALLFTITAECQLLSLSSSHLERKEITIGSNSSVYAPKDRNCWMAFFFLFENDTPFLTRRHPAPDPKWRSVRMNKKMSHGVRARDGPSAPARGGVWGWGCQSVGGRGELLLGWRSVSDRRWSPHLPRSVRPAPPGCDAPLPTYAPVIPGQGASSRPVPKLPAAFEHCPTALAAGWTSRTNARKKGSPPPSHAAM